MKLFKIAEGPWQKVFEGRFQESLVELYQNPASVFLVIVYEEENEKVSGAVVEFYKVFSSIGELEGFVDTLPREVIVLEKHDPRQTIKYFMLASAPTYVRWKEEEFLKETDKMLKKIANSASLISDVSKAYDVKLVELNKSDEIVKQTFFAEPLTVAVLATSKTVEESQKAKEAKIAVGEIKLGITKEGALVEEPLSLFMGALVSMGKEEERMHVLHVLMEGMLLSNVPVIVFDRKKRFAGMMRPTRRGDELKKFKLEIEPIGFPVKEFYSPQDVRVDLLTLNPEGLAELFGVNEPESRENISKMITQSNATSLEMLVKTVKRAELSEEINPFQANRVIRFFNLLEKRYPNTFGEQNNISEISKNWAQVIGRLSIVHTEGLDARQELMVMHSVVREIAEHYKEKGTSKRLRAMVVFPNASEIFTSHNPTILAQEMIHDLVEMKEYGVAFCVSAELPNYLYKPLLDSIETRISVTAGNDVGVDPINRKQYRLLLHSGLSECTERV